MSTWSCASTRYNDSRTGAVLDKLGLSPNNITIAVISMVVILMFLLAFIFAGIAAFATPGGFTSSINSIFPVLSGAGASSGGETDEADDDDSDRLNSLINSVVDAEAIAE